MRTLHPDRPWLLLLVGLGVVPVMACASTQPMELRAARQEYMKAQEGPASRLAPGELHQARMALDKAEASFNADPYDPETPDLAYLAWRKSQLAIARAETTRVEGIRSAAVQRLDTLHRQTASATRSQLSQTQQQLEAEQLARSEAERKVREAEEKLSNLAEIRHDERGTVLTLSGTVLFASGKASLLPMAKERLNQVAEALKTTSNRLVVEGYTDSRGDSVKNRRLSKARAEVVRDFLVSRGVSEEQVAAVGLGESSPIADNTTPEGRANNRRVEIVIQPATLPAGPGTPGTPGIEQGTPDTDKATTKPKTKKKVKKPVEE